MKTATLTSGSRPYPFASFIGPRIPGGRYFCGFWRKAYTVERTGTVLHWRGNNPEPCAFFVTCRWEDGITTTHCTHWNAGPINTDRVLEQPAPFGWDVVTA